MTCADSFETQKICVSADSDDQITSNKIVFCCPLSQSSKTNQDLYYQWCDSLNNKVVHCSTEEYGSKMTVARYSMCQLHISEDSYSGES